MSNRRLKTARAWLQCLLLSLAWMWARPLCTWTVCHLTTAPWGVDYNVHPFNKYQFGSALHFSFTSFSAALLSRNLSCLHFFLLFSPASQRVSLYCFWIFPSFEFWFLPSACALLSPFLKLFLFFCVSLLCLCLTDSLSSIPLMFLSVSWFFSHKRFWSHYTSLFRSVSCPLFHTLTHIVKLFSSGLPADQSWHVSHLSCKVTELLDSSQLSGWPISALTHTF